MHIFQPPPRTRYDLNFTLAGIPVRIHPLFWLMAVLLGAAGDINQLLIWVIVVFVSILVHELGHSLAMRLYGQHSYIVLHVAGGLAVPESSRGGGRETDVSLDRIQRVFISFAGPLAGFLLAAVVIAAVVASGGLFYIDWWSGVIPLPTAVLFRGGWIANSVVQALLWVNVFWGLVNLMPVYPLDGGSIARHLLVRADPWNGATNSLWLSVICGAFVAIGGWFFLNSTYVALLFGYLAYQSYQSLSGRSRNRFCPRSLTLFAVLRTILPAVPGKG